MRARAGLSPGVPMQQTRKWLALASVAGAATVIVLMVGFAGWRAKRALRLSTEEVQAEREVRFDIRPFAPPVGVSFELVSAPAVFRQAALFQDHLYIGGPGGLLEYDLNGVSSRQFIPGRDLPPSPIVALAPALLTDSQEQELVVATAQEGLLAFNGHTPPHIRPPHSQSHPLPPSLPPP